MSGLRNRRVEDLFMVAAAALLLLTSVVSELWVVGLAGCLFIIGLVALPSTRRLGLFAGACALGAGVVAAVLLAVVR